MAASGRILSFAAGHTEVDLTMPFSSLQFRFPWRPYQQRVLDAMDHHLADGRLHLVAAPGAGKTSLGLELFRRLGQRTLVLSPTRVIRDQWLLRLQDFATAVPWPELGWVSNSLQQPAVLTSVTYQALHGQLSDGGDDNDGDGENLTTAPSERELAGIISLLQNHQIGVLILDEAHHLRQEWWRALTKVCQALPQLVLVSLTATPPYDVDQAEWLKYEELCGPIDEEISVPELVKAGTLCPHQDYIWAVAVAEGSKQQIRDYDQRVAALCHQLAASAEFNRVVANHPWLTRNADLAAIAREAQLAMALLVYLKAMAQPLPPGLCRLLDLTVSDIPALGRRWWQLLVEGVLFSPSFDHGPEAQAWVEQLKKNLRAGELLKGRELALVHARFVARSLATSSTKIDACSAVHRLEWKQRGDQLRQVILTDYIRDEQRNGLNHGPLTLGAWPVFERLLVDSPVAERVALLSGRLTVIHQSLLAACQPLVAGRLTATPLPEHPDYCQLQGALDQLTTALTALLVSGQVRVLVGTRALLGEGWDAPVINSLVLASSVGSYMLTNQMRGRAIRIDRHQPDKVSSIWHLVAIDGETASGLTDYRELTRRFETFVGLAERQPLVESGLSRLNAQALASIAMARDNERQKRAKGGIWHNNLQMTRRLYQHRQLAARWQQALAVNGPGRVVPAVRAPQQATIRGYHIGNTLKQLLLTILGSLVVAVFLALDVGARSGLRVMLVALALAVAGTLLWRLPQVIRMVRMLSCHLPLDGSLKQIGAALCEALCRTRLIETAQGRLHVTSQAVGDGTFYLALSGGTFYESSLFADCLAELLAPIENPRYLVTRPGEVVGIKRLDYHAVPQPLAVKKEHAEIFYAAWCRFLGPGELIYCRSGEGRTLLARARMRALSALDAAEVKRLDRWQ